MSEQDILDALNKLPVNKHEAFLDLICGSDAALKEMLSSRISRHLLQHSSTAAAKPVAHDVISSTVTFPQIAPEILNTGRIINGRYKLISELGEGGMGSVFIAEQLSPVKREVALKLIKPGMDSRTVVARFEVERQALAMMNHPHIAKMLDGGMTETGQPYFVMELVKGLPITKFCDYYHLTLKERLDLFITICNAVEHAHQKGIIHRDLKPSNILVGLIDGKPTAKVIDFGIAKALHHKLTDRTLHTSVGSIIGTLEYMAPEQAEINNLDVDTRADIYALGVVLYELLASSPPFSRKELANAAFDEMLRMIREVEPPKPSTKLQSSDELPVIAAGRKIEPKKLISTISGELDAIVMKCLEKDRNNRYSTPTSLSNDLTNWLQGDPISIRPTSNLMQLWLWVKRNIRLTLFVTGLAIILGLLTGMVYLKQGIGQFQNIFGPESYVSELAQIIDRNGMERPWYLAWNWWDSIFLRWLDLPYVTTLFLTLIYGSGGLLLTLFISRKSMGNEVTTGMSFGLLFGLVVFLTAAGPAWLINSIISPTLLDLRSMTQAATEKAEIVEQARDSILERNPELKLLSEEKRFGALFESMQIRNLTGIVAGLWLGVIYTLILFSLLAIYQTLIAGYLIRTNTQTKPIIVSYFELTWSGTILALVLSVYVAGYISGAGKLAVLWQDENGRRCSFLILVLILWTVVSWAFLVRMSPRINTYLQFAMLIAIFSTFASHQKISQSWIEWIGAVVVVLVYIRWISYLTTTGILKLTRVMLK